MPSNLDYVVGSLDVRSQNRQVSNRPYSLTMTREYTSPRSHPRTPLPTTSPRVVTIARICPRRTCLSMSAAAGNQQFSCSGRRIHRVSERITTDNRRCVGRHAQAGSRRHILANGFRLHRSLSEKINQDPHRSILAMIAKICPL
ncbi:hypothetical protein K523DRAFT_110912 [Schizophyllum commune Tattone D]|nr:hypothetical protein K523DRAFT_110912 [Schizophyllum commune Tattone D]